MSWYKIDFNDVFMNGLTTAQVGCVVKYKCLCQQLEVDVPDLKKLKAIFNSRELKFVLNYFKVHQDFVQNKSEVCHDFVQSKSEVSQEFVTTLPEVCHDFDTTLSEVCSKSDNKNKDIACARIYNNINNLNNTEREKEKKERKKINKKSFSKEFEEWWKEVPRKVSKDDANRKFNTILAGNLATFDELLAGIKRYAEHCKGKEEQYIKHPSTWLNQGCWKDEYRKPLDWLDEKKEHTLDWL